MKGRTLLLAATASVLLLIGGIPVPASGQSATADVPVHTGDPSVVPVLNQSASEGVLTYTDYPQGAIAPASASGCNGRVCIYTTGSGLYNTKWRTTATAYYSDGTLCPDVYFYTKAPYALLWYLFDVYINPGTNCHRAPQGGSTIWSYATPDCTVANPCGFVNQTKQCNAWEPNPPLSGFPCVTVHN